MSEVIEDDMEELPIEVFQKTFENISRKHGNKYKFIINAGYSLKLALFHLFQVVWRTEKIPNSWHESTVIQIQKGKSDTKNLDNIRHLHDRDEFSKFFGQLVLSQAKDNIFSNMSKFQIASKPGHQPSEHLLC